MGDKPVSREIYEVRMRAAISEENDYPHEFLLSREAATRPRQCFGAGSAKNLQAALLLSKLLSTQ
jgi:hypothetical protein